MVHNCIAEAKCFEVSKCNFFSRISLAWGILKFCLWSMNTVQKSRISHGLAILLHHSCSIISDCILGCIPLSRPKIGIPAAAFLCNPNLMGTCLAYLHILSHMHPFTKLSFPNRYQMHPNYQLHLILHSFGAAACGPLTYHTDPEGGWLSLSYSSTLGFGTGASE